MVADCPQVPVASVERTLAGTTLRMVRKQKMAELIVTVRLEVDFKRGGSPSAPRGYPVGRGVQAPGASSG